MPIYVLMTKLAPATLKGRRSAGRDWIAKVEKLCPDLKWVSHYALLGPYDFMDIYEAPNDKTAFRVSLLSRELGAVTAESWPAMPYDKFLKIADRVDESLGEVPRGGPGKKRNKKKKKG